MSRSESHDVSDVDQVLADAKTAIDAQHDSMVHRGPDTFGEVSPPKSNGELAFGEPWQSRAFGLTAALVDSGHLSWPEFQSALIVQVASHADNEYWVAWLEALGVLSHGRGFVQFEQVLAQSRLLAKQSLHDH